MPGIPRPPSRTTGSRPSSRWPRPLALTCTPAAEEWRFDIETVAKSERGFDRTRQGESVTLHWPVAAGAAALVLRPTGGP